MRDGSVSDQGSHAFVLLCGRPPFYMGQLRDACRRLFRGQRGHSGMASFRVSFFLRDPHFSLFGGSEVGAPYFYFSRWYFLLGNLLAFFSTEVTGNLLLWSGLLFLVLVFLPFNVFQFLKSLTTSCICLVLCRFFWPVQRYISLHGKVVERLKTLPKLANVWQRHNLNAF